VRRQALLTVNALAHANVDLFSPEVSRFAFLVFTALFFYDNLITFGPCNQVLKTVILPVLYLTCEPDARHVRTIDLGPFKHKVDDGPYSVSCCSFDAASREACFLCFRIAAS
jgi:hypothetical protein